MTTISIPKPKDSPGAPPAFAAVTLAAPAALPHSTPASLSSPIPTSVRASASASPPLALTLRLPTGVETQITGLDADTLTLVILELVGTAARSAACLP